MRILETRLVFKGIGEILPARLMWKSLTFRKHETTLTVQNFDGIGSLVDACRSMRTGVFSSVAFPLRDIAASSAILVIVFISFTGFRCDDITIRSTIVVLRYRSRCERVKLCDWLTWNSLHELHVQSESFLKNFLNVRLKRVYTLKGILKLLLQYSFHL